MYMHRQEKAQSVAEQREEKNHLPLLRGRRRAN